MPQTQQLPPNLWSLSVSAFHRRDQKNKSSSRSKPTIQPYYPAVIKVCYDFRVATSNQLQQRLVQFLPSARTARRHIKYLNELGWLGVLVPDAPHWPFVYYPTRRGLKSVQDAYCAKGIMWEPAVSDHIRPRGLATRSLRHELLASQFQLLLWQTVQHRDDLRLHTSERRYFHPNNQLTFRHDSQEQQIVPDLGALIGVARRDGPAGLIQFFVEVDCGTESAGVLRSKFERYQNWAESGEGQAYLTALYKRHGARNPRPQFRLLLIVQGAQPKSDDQRLMQVFQAALDLPPAMQARLWLTSGEMIAAHEDNPAPCAQPLWLKVSDAHEWAKDYRTLAQQSKRVSPRRLKLRQRQLVAEKTAAMPRHQLFPNA